MHLLKNHFRFLKTTLPGPMDAGRLLRMKTCQNLKDLPARHSPDFSGRRWAFCFNLLKQLVRNIGV